MTELIEDLEILKERILSERCAQELPGDSPMVQTARKLLLAGLLGHLPTNDQRREGPETFLPALISPVSPETAPEVSIDTESAEAPGDAPAGETQEEVAQEPPPAPPMEPEAVIIPVDRERQPGSSGAIFEARVYVLSCLDKSQGINLRSVCNLTGWDNIQASKFIRDLQEEYRQVQRQSVKTGRPLKAGVDEGVANLLRAIENEEDEGEPEPEELEAIESESASVPQMPTQTDKPRWWADSEARYCKTCKEAIPPKFTRNKAGKQQWEGLCQYNLRSYCAEHSPKKGGRAKTDGKD